MSKNSIIFSCSKCGAQSQKWLGRCLECGTWGSFKEDVQENATNSNIKSALIKPAVIINLNDIELKNFPRIKTNLDEVDRVLGGGIIPGSLILVSGEPGIGKSTIIAQIANRISGNTVYASGEESSHQVKDRLIRLDSELQKIQFISETNLDKIIATIDKKTTSLLIIDSIQTVYSSDSQSEISSIGQIKTCTAKLMEFAKQNNIPIIIIGHITKDGSIAGPKNLEHMVDVVIYFETDSRSDLRILRTTKNRFGSTNEIGIFEMTTKGFIEIKNPSLMFLNRNNSNLPGCVTSCVMEGTRPFFVEIQALVTKTAFGYPQRKSSGYDLNRLQVLIAVLSKKTRFNLSNQDVILNIVGGHKINDHALDLAICASIISSFSNKAIDSNTLALGEVGLTGEIRLIPKINERLDEAHKLGFSKFIIPTGYNKKNNIEIIELKNIKDLIL
ncbi:MAG: DNA repair protein RadA [Candidatus Falkowbacteria bacterium]|nr:DNA repair protein RadA [Candidatus Falkowbacteria bacterium]